MYIFMIRIINPVVKPTDFYHHFWIEFALIKKAKPAIQFHLFY
jgi:hypothetical protein